MWSLSHYILEGKETLFFFFVMNQYVLSLCNPIPDEGGIMVLLPYPQRIYIKD